MLTSVLKVKIMFSIDLDSRRLNLELCCDKHKSGFKTPSKAQWLRCKPLQNVLLIPPLAGLRFFIGLRLALEPDLRF
jgi:hypothetical protein